MTTGTARLGDPDLYAITPAERRRLWGGEVGFVAQSAVDSLNPALRIGRQFGEVLRIHQHLRGDASTARQQELLDRVGIPNPREALRRYPHQFSGGQLQRIAIAIAVACSPSVLVLDEPTTGLDVRTQQQISALLQELVREAGMGALYVSHNLALMHEITDRLYVMYAGQVVESAASGAVLRDPRHPYTRALLDAVPAVDTPVRLAGIPGLAPSGAVSEGCAFAPRCIYAEPACTAGELALVHLPGGRDTRCRRHAELDLGGPRETIALTEAPIAGDAPLLDIRALTYRYHSDAPDAVHEVTLSVRRGESVGIVGESGSGKSTMLRVISGLLEPTSGEVLLGGNRLAGVVDRRDRPTKRAVQLIFQNPDSSLNPAHPISEILRRPLRVFGACPRDQEDARVEQLLSMVNLPVEMAFRYPDELSGGQKQRVAIARAFAAAPDVLLCDEITSALDVSVQATVITLLEDLARAQGVAVVFVGHDLAVVRTVASRIAVMRDGSICEQGTSEDVFDRPSDAYTKELLGAIPALPAREVAAVSQITPSYQPTLREYR